METEPRNIKTKKNNYWIILTVVLSFVVISLILSQKENKSEKTSKKFSSSNQLGQNDNNRKRNHPSNNDEDNDDNENQDNFDPNQGFTRKGYLSNKDIQLLRGWGLEASDVPDLQTKKRNGVVNTLAVAGEKGFCSELVIILKKDPC